MIKRGLTKKITPRQKEILKFIHKTIKKHGFSPSIREIGEAVGLSSSSTVHSHLNRLEFNGFIKRHPAKPRTIEVSSIKHIIYLPVLDNKQITSVDNLDEEILDTFILPADFVESENSFMTKVTSASLKDAGIYPDDNIIVNKTQNFKNGDLVLVLIDNEFSPRRYESVDGSVNLAAENQNYKDVPMGDFQIVGKITGIVRKIN
ncbi:MAG: transcriptional repressor LexA [Armatimonadota bacterium]